MVKAINFVLYIFYHNKNSIVQCVKSFHTYLVWNMAQTNLIIFITLLSLLFLFSWAMHIYNLEQYNVQDILMKYFCIFIDKIVKL